MKLFTCHHCGQLLYFENIRCERCGHTVGYLPDRNDLLALTTVEGSINTYADSADGNQRYRYCANQAHGACNWLLPIDSPEEFCVACQLNNTVPNLGNAELVQLWRKLEIAKHRLVYTLLQLGLPVSPRSEENDTDLAFDFLAEEDATEKVVMGHANGLITINVAEADEAKRVQTKKELGEPYRTLLGHFRHESGHYYWDKLIATSEHRLNEFRNMFGDERADYAASLKKYYSEGQNVNWSDQFVSLYASAHPWEDWAETWAHYLHIMDTLETAHAVGMRVRPAAASQEVKPVAQFKEDPLMLGNFQQLMDLWVPLTVAVNSLNRSMGQPDFYPFVIPPAVVAKLDFIHQLCKEVQADVSPQKKKSFLKFWN